MTSLLSLEKQAARNNSATIYRASGKISLETVNQFIQQVRPEPAQHLVLDLAGVSFLDSAGVGALVSLYVNRRNQGKTVALAGLASQAKAVLTVAGLGKLLPVCESVEEAAGKTEIGR